MNKFAQLLFVLLIVASCSYGFRGGGLDTSTENALPIKMEKEPPGFGENKLKKQARWYRVYWGAMTVGDLFINLIPTEEGYGMRTSIQSKGLAKMVSNWQGESGSTMRFVYPDKYLPTRFKTSFQLRDRKRRIDIHWDENGKVIKEINEPPENRNKRPAVDEELKQNTGDPLTSILMARSELRKSILEGRTEFDVPYYDGRRKTNLHFKIYGADKNGNIHIAFVEKPIAGYTNNELKEMKKNSPAFHLYLSPHDLFPLAGKGESFVGTAYMRLKKECATLDECIKASNEN